jgi:hypothetical protein
LEGKLKKFLMAGMVLGIGCGFLNAFKSRPQKWSASGMKSKVKTRTALVENVVKKETELKSTVKKNQMNLQKQFQEEVNPEKMKIRSDEQAIDWVICHFGDNHGDWKWNCLWQDEQKFFIKATSQQQLALGAMSGTAMSVLVKSDGKMEWNF